MTHTKVVNLNDLENPISEINRVAMNNRILGTESITYIQLLMQPNQVELDDSLVGVLFQPEVMTFTSIREELSTDQLSYGESQFKYQQLLVSFKDGGRTEQFKRKVFNFFELIGILGGLFEIFDVGFAILVGIISHQLFKNELRIEVSKAQNQYDQLKVMIDKLELKLSQNSNNLDNQIANLAARNAMPQNLRIPKEDNKNEHM